MISKGRGWVVVGLLALGSAGRATDYEYDDLDRLVRVVRDDGSEERYAYDAAGNITSVTTNGRASTAVVAGPGGPGSRPHDRDVYEFQGAVGETVTVRVEAEPREAGIGRRISLEVRAEGPCARLRRQDVSVLPNEITAVLPADARYEIVVHRHHRVPQEARYAGAYRLTLEARAETCASLAAAERSGQPPTRPADPGRCGSAVPAQDER